MFSARLVLVSACCALLTTADAFAQHAAEKQHRAGASGAKSNDAQAAELRAEGEELAGAGDCDGAIGPLRSAWALRESAKTAVLLGECEVRLGRFPEAAHHLSRALELLPVGAERTRVESMLQDASSRVARLDIVVNEPGAIVIVGKLVVESPVKDLFVEPGDVLVSVKKSGFREQQQTVRTTAGKTARLEFKLVTNRGQTDLEPSDESPAAGAMLPAYVGGGLALVVLGIGGGLRVAGKSSGADADMLLDKLEGQAPCSATPPPDDCATIKNLRIDHDRYVNASTGLFVAGGVLLGGAMIYGIVMTRQLKKDVAILPIVSPTHNGLFIEGRF